MNTATLFNRLALSLCLAAAFALCAAPRSHAQLKGAGQGVAVETPTFVARSFYTALREGRFRDALMMSVYRPAIESLSAAELDELRPDFARLATQVPPDFDFTGESITGDDATVFMKSGSERDRNVKVEPVDLIRQGGTWVVGNRSSAEEVKKLGKRFFFEQRIAAHEDDAEDMMKRISAAELAYALQNAGSFGDLNALVHAGYVPQDILGTETTGYRFTVTTSSDSKSYTARAEPERYNHSGRLSFYLDKFGIQKKDTGGKPFQPKK